MSLSEEKCGTGIGRKDFGGMYVAGPDIYIERVLNGWIVITGSSDYSKRPDRYVVETVSSLLDTIKTLATNQLRTGEK